MASETMRFLSTVAFCFLLGFFVGTIVYIYSPTPFNFILARIRGHFDISRYSNINQSNKFNLSAHFSIIKILSER